MNREIKFRGVCAKSKELVYGDLIHGVGWKKGNVYILPDKENLAYVKHCDPLDGVQVIPETVGQYFRVEDQDFYEGDIIEFWLCYPTTQTHEGDNIPGGSYTEPDEPQLVKVKAEVIFSEELCRLEWSIIGKLPYGFSSYCTYPLDNQIPLLWRDRYDKNYVRWVMGCPDYGMVSDQEEGEYAELLMELTGMTEEDMLACINKITIVGNIHDIIKD